MIRIAIVDDREEQCALLKSHIKRYFAEHPENYSIDEYLDPGMFLAAYTAQYDFITLDIRMPQMDGMALAQRIRKIDANVILVFITDLTSWATRGYEVEALDFMVKPVKYYDFALKMKRVMARHERNGTSDSVLIETNAGHIRLSQRDILYVEVMGHSVTYHTREESFQYYGTLKEVEGYLNPEMFARCNSCYLVNLLHVESVDQLSCVVAGHSLKMSQTRKKAFLSRMKDYYASGG